MSKKVEAPRVERIDLQSIAIRLNQLRDLIAILQDQVNTLTQELTELQLALSTIKGLEEVVEETEVLVAADRLATILVPAKILGNWSNKVVINIGRNYYARVDKDTAIKMLNKRINITQNLLRLRSQELNSVVNEYNSLQQALQAMYYRQIQQARVPEKPRVGGG